jgi:transposase
MTKKKRTACYPVEFKREAVRMAAQPDRMTKDVAEQLGIHPNQLTRWKREVRAKRSADCGREKTPGQMQIQWLERELARVREERDILKKAIGFLSPRRKRSSGS